MNSSAPYSQERSEKNSSDGHRSPPKVAEGEDAGERPRHASEKPNINGRYNTATKDDRRTLDSKGTIDHNTETEQYTSFPQTKSMYASAESLDDKRSAINRSAHNETAIPAEHSMSPVREVLAGGDQTQENVLQQQEQINISSNRDLHDRPVEESPLKQRKIGMSPRKPPSSRGSARGGNLDIRNQRSS